MRSGWQTAGTGDRARRDIAIWEVQAMWITDYRTRYGLEPEQLGEMIRKFGARQDPPLRVSDILLYRLESDPKFRTVPGLANLIAEACGATAEQRDALVLERYRGTWKPPRRRRTVKAEPAKAPKLKPEAPPQKPRETRTTGRTGMAPMEISAPSPSTRAKRSSTPTTTAAAGSPAT